LFRILESFGECLGLKINNEKTDIILLGDNSLHEKDSQNTVFVNLSKFWVYILVMTKDKETASTFIKLLRG